MHRWGGLSKRQKQEYPGTVDCVPLWVRYEIVIDRLRKVLVHKAGNEIGPQLVEDLQLLTAQMLLIIEARYWFTHDYLYL